MKFVKFGIFALSFGLFVASCGNGESTETPAADTTMAAPAPEAAPAPAMDSAAAAAPVDSAAAAAPATK